MCREEAQALLKMMQEVWASEPKLTKVPLVGIIKEVAPTGKVKTDSELGVGDFQRDFFPDVPVYLDEEKVFYTALGNRKIGLPTWNPFKLWSGYQKLAARLKGKDIEGNMVGEGITLGGVLVIGAGQGGIVHEYLEKTGTDPDLFLPAVKEALLNMAK